MELIKHKPRVTLVYDFELEEPSVNLNKSLDVVGHQPITVFEKEKNSAFEFWILSC